jgi:hypothetical protein
MVAGEDPQDIVTAGLPRVAVDPPPCRARRCPAAPSVLGQRRWGGQAVGAQAVGDQHSHTRCGALSRRPYTQCSCPRLARALPP